jgi:hypothetical protein
MSSAISGSAKAVTPFGPLAGRTPVTVTDQGTDSVVIAFHCGATPVVLALAGENYLAFVRECITKAGDMHRAALDAALDAAVSAA